MGANQQTILKVPRYENQFSLQEKASLDGQLKLMHSRRDQPKFSLSVYGKEL